MLNLGIVSFYPYFQPHTPTSIRHGNTFVAFWATGLYNVFIIRHEHYFFLQTTSHLPVLVGQND